MSLLNNLPNEILHRIIILLPRSDAASLRLVNHRVKDVATEGYFARVSLYAHWNPMYYDGPTEYDANIFKNILDSDDLKKLVKRVDLYMCNPNCDPSTDDFATLCGGFEHADYLFTKDWHRCFMRLDEFENLRGVTVIFDRYGCASPTGQYSGRFSESLMERTHRIDWVRRVLSLLGTRVQDLSIRHFQNDDGFRLENELDQDQSALENSVLSGLRSLRMTMIHPEGRNQVLKDDDGDSYYCWKHFPRLWLIPTTQTLNHLVLYSDTPIGWFSKLDLRGVHFERLRTLTFGQFIFSHDWQFDWIESHGSTLRELNLDYCSILHQILHANDIEDWLDHEGYPQRTDDPFQGWPNSRVQFPETQQRLEALLKSIKYPTRWHDVFIRFSNALPKLHTFRFGVSEGWIFNTPSTLNRIDSFPGLPIVPWESETSIKNPLFAGRYLHYNDWNGRYDANWEAFKEEYIEKFRQYEALPSQRWFGMMEEVEECDEEDEEALDVLLEVLATRSK